MIYLFENGRPRAMQWWPLQLILVTSNGGHPNNAYVPLHNIHFWKWQTKDSVIVTSIADFSDLKKWPPIGGHPNYAYVPLHDIPFWKWQTMDNALVTTAADFSDLQKWPPIGGHQNNAYLPKHDLEGSKRYIIQGLYWWYIMASMEVNNWGQRIAGRYTISESWDQGQLIGKVRKCR